LVEGLTDGDIWRLDIFEGSEYERQRVKVRVLEQGEGMGDVQQAEAENIEGEEVDAETYIWVAGANRLEAEEWDFTEFVRDKMKRWVGREAAETDEGFQGRASLNGACMRSLRDGKLMCVIDVDDAVAALGDPTGGRGINGGISRQLDGGKSEDEVLQSAI
jgi:hypothetical protein